MRQLLAEDFTIPGASGNQAVPIPSGIPETLTGGLNTTGTSFIQLILNFIFLGAAFIAVIMIIFSGIQWVTSQGEPGKMAAARSRLMYAVIGLVVVGLSFLIVRVVITVIGANPTTFINVK
jgi:hypothetical protein